jgi:hypothetical protein
MFDDFVNKIRAELPDWRISCYEKTSFSNGLGTRTGRWEVVLGRSKPDWVVVGEADDLYSAFEIVIGNAQKMEENHKRKYA